MLSQVHVIENAVARHRETLMMVFRTHPKPKTIDAAMDHVFSRLGSGRRSKWIHTEPYHYTRTPATYTVFRPDGECNHNFIDQILTPRLVAALSVSNTNKVKTIEHRPVPSNGNQPNTVILYIRQSTWSQEECLANQLWSILTNPFQGVFPLADNTKLVVVIEVCPSSVHPLSARPAALGLFDSLNGPFTVLTANPDRLTRRLDEVKTLVEGMQRVQGRWMTRSCKGDGLDKDKWYDVSDHQSAVKEQVQAGKIMQVYEHALVTDPGTSGREINFQRGWHMRCITAETRVLVHPDNTKSICALHELFRATFQHHGIEHLVLYCRVSPKGQSHSRSEEIPSLERQHEFMKRLLPPEIPTTVVRDNSVSASNGESLTSVKSTMDGQTSNTCFVSVSLDRVFRKHSFIYDLQEHFASYQSYNHLALALLWDYQTRVNCRKSMLLPSTFTRLNAVVEWDEYSRKAFRAQPSSVNIPTVQPIIWCSKSILSATVEAIVSRHGQAAEDFGKAFKLSQFGGSRNMPPDLEEIDIDEKCIGPKREARWFSFLTEALNINPSNLEIRSHIEGSSCSCGPTADSFRLTDTTKPHSVLCQCMCAYCKGRRACVCVVGQCVCDVICDCRCDHCHSDNRPLICEECGNERTPGCHGCNYCQYRKSKTTKESKMCSNPGCTNPQSTRMIWCSIDCYLSVTPVEKVRYCKIEGCRFVSPPGNGAICSYHRLPSNRQSECSNPGCTNRQTCRTSWCSVDCYLASTPAEKVRYCKIEGCAVPMPPGNGATCTHHKNAGYGVTRKSQSKAAQEAALAAPNASGSRKRKR